jgi:hypothetical protein
LTAVESSLAANITPLLPITNEPELEHQMRAVCESIEQQSSLATALEDYNIEEEVMNDYQRQLNTFTELQFESYRRENTEIKAKLSAIIETAMEKSIQNIRKEVDTALLGIKADKPTGIRPYSKALDKKYFTEKDAMSKAIETAIKKLLHGSIRSVNVGEFIADAVKRLEAACVEMSGLLTAKHSAVATSSMTALAKQCAAAVNDEAMSYFEAQAASPEGICSEHTLRQGFADIVKKAASVGKTRVRAWESPELESAFDAELDMLCSAVLDTLLFSHRNVSAMQSKLSAENQKKAQREQERRAEQAEEERQQKQAAAIQAQQQQEKKRQLEEQRAAAAAAALAASKKRAAVSSVESLPQPTSAGKKRRVTAVMGTAARVPSSVQHEQESEEAAVEKVAKKPRRSAAKAAAAPVTGGNSDDMEVVDEQDGADGGNKLSVAEQKKRAKKWHEDRKKALQEKQSKDKKTHIVATTAVDEEEEEEEEEEVDVVEAAKRAARDRVQQRTDTKRGSLSSGAEAASPTGRATGGRGKKKGK